MEKKKVLGLAAGGAVGVLAVAAAAFALAPERRGLAALDLDGDGQIVNSEIQHSARQRFAERDANGDGRLTGEELPRRRHGRQGRRGSGHDDFVATPAEPEQTQPTGDAAGAATPTAADPAPTAGQAAPVRRGFAAADLDGDGALTLREFYAHHAARAARADTDGNGTISTEEIAAFRPRRGDRGH